MLDLTDYKILAKQAAAFAEAENDFVPLFANVAALLYDTLDRINWAGFYLMDKGSLLLGPFQGKLACIRIEIGTGVCGKALEEDRVLRVPNVHEFPGHIACDSASLSEIVVPIHSEGKVIGVLDIDSPCENRFSAEDEEGLITLVRELEKITDFSRVRK